MLSLKAAFSLCYFTFIKELSSSSSLSAIKVVPPAYLRLLIFLLAILTPACASSSLALLMMYSAFKFNKQGDTIQHWCTPFTILNQSGVPCLVLTVASWPAYRFCRRQVRNSGISISWKISHSLLWSTHKGFSIVNESEVDFFCNPLAFSMIQQMLAIASLVLPPFLNLAWTSGNSQFTYC